MQIQFELSLADFLDAQRLHATRNFFRRVLRVVNFYAFPVFGACMLCLAISTRADRSPALVMLICSLVLMGYPAYYRFTMLRTYKRTRTAEGACSLIFEESGVRIGSTNFKSDINWSAFQTKRENNKVILLYIAPGKFVVIPKRACSDEDIREIRAMLSRHLRSPSQ